MKIITNVFKKPVGYLLLIVMMGGCAASYTPINPEARKYRTGDSLAPVTFFYKYDVLGIQGNKRYVKKEAKNGLSVLSVKITNNTDSVINTSSIKLYASTRQIIPMNATSAALQLRQGTVAYLLYCLMFLTISSNSSSYGEDQHPTIIPIGIPIGIGNMIGAGSANQNLLREFMKYDITDRIIKPHETLYGIITLKETTHEALRIDF